MSERRPGISNYRRIQRANLETLAERFEITTDQLPALERAHAIAAIRIGETDGWWRSDDAKEAVIDDALKDIQRDFARDGIKGKLQRWILRKAIQAVIVILVDYYEHELAAGQESGGNYYRARDFDGVCRGWGRGAEEYLLRQSG